MASCVESLGLETAPLSVVGTVVGCHDFYVDLDATSVVEDMRQTGPHFHRPTYGEQDADACNAVVLEEPDKLVKQFGRFCVDGTLNVDSLEGSQEALQVCIPKGRQVVDRVAGAMGAGRWGVPADGITPSGWFCMPYTVRRERWVLRPKRHPHWPIPSS